MSAILGVLLVIAVAIGAFILAVWMVVWNVTDIQQHGINFWNAFWLLIVLAGVGGGAGAGSRRG